MRYSCALTRHRALARGRSVGRAFVLCTGLVFLTACDGSRTGPEASGAYRITDGACGVVVFVENLGADSATAVEMVEARKANAYGQGEIVLEAHALEVVDEHGTVPEPDFYALRVLEAGTGVLVHSVTDVITTDGDLFGLQWCPD